MKHWTAGFNRGMFASLKKSGGVGRVKSGLFLDVLLFLGLKSEKETYSLTNDS